MDETIVQYDAKRVHTIGKKARLDYFSTTLDNSFTNFSNSRKQTCEITILTPPPTPPLQGRGEPQRMPPRNSPPMSGRTAENAAAQLPSHVGENRRECRRATPLPCRGEPQRMPPRNSPPMSGRTAENAAAQLPSHVGEGSGAGSVT